jgi:hypothetical protein
MAFLSLERYTAYLLKEYSILSILLATISVNVDYQPESGTVI